VRPDNGATNTFRRRQWEERVPECAVVGQLSQRPGLEPQPVNNLLMGTRDEGACRELHRCTGKHLRDKEALSLCIQDGHSIPVEPL
jgi:hypothetical protein